MRVAMTFTFDDNERRFVSRYVAARTGERQPMLATRHMLRDYIYDAISNQNTGAQDTLALEEEAD